jgi:hypothetical protein
MPGQCGVKHSEDLPEPGSVAAASFAQILDHTFQLETIRKRKAGKRAPGFPAFLLSSF